MIEDIHGSEPQTVRRIKRKKKGKDGGWEGGGRKEGRLEEDKAEEGKGGEENAQGQSGEKGSWLQLEMETLSKARRK